MFINRKQILVLKILSTSILFLAAISYENALKTRIIIFMVLFILYILVNIARYNSKYGKLRLLTFVIEIGIIYFLEFNSLPAFVC